MWRLFPTFPFVHQQAALHPPRLRRCLQVSANEKVGICFLQAKEFVSSSVGNVCLDYGLQVGKSCLPQGPRS
jgi:hypothetical protein